MFRSTHNATQVTDDGHSANQRFTPPGGVNIRNPFTSSADRQPIQYNHNATQFKSNIPTSSSDAMTQNTLSMPIGPGANYFSRSAPDPWSGDGRRGIMNGPVYKRNQKVQNFGWPEPKQNPAWGQLQNTYNKYQGQGFFNLNNASGSRNPADLWAEANKRENHLQMMPWMDGAIPHYSQSGQDGSQNSTPGGWAPSTYNSVGGK